MRAYALGVATYTMLTAGSASAGCDQQTCDHDWQCDDSDICIPYEGRNRCFLAPVCDVNEQCADNDCVQRSVRILAGGNRDPFTTDDLVKKTCGGDAGPPESDNTIGCGFGNDPGLEPSVGGFPQGGDSGTGGESEGGGGSGGLGLGGALQGGAGGVLQGGAGGVQGGAGGAGGVLQGGAPLGGGGGK